MPQWLAGCPTRCTLKAILKTDTLKRSRSYETNTLLPVKRASPGLIQAFVLQSCTLGLELNTILQFSIKRGSAFLQPPRAYPPATPMEALRSWRHVSLVRL